MTDRPQKLRNSKNMCQPGHTRTPPRALRRPPSVEPRSHAAPPHAFALVLVLPSPWSPPRRPPPLADVSNDGAPRSRPARRPRQTRVRDSRASPPRRARPRPPPRTRRRPRPGTRTRPRPRQRAKRAPVEQPPKPLTRPLSRRSRSGRITSSASSRSCTSSASRASSTGPSSRASSTAPWSRALSRTPRGDSKSTRERRLRLLHGALPPGAPPDLRHRREPRG